MTAFQIVDCARPATIKQQPIDLLDEDIEESMARAHLGDPPLFHSLPKRLSELFPVGSQAVGHAVLVRLVDI